MRGHFWGQGCVLCCCLLLVMGACSPPVSPPVPVHSPLLAAYHFTPFAGHQPAGQLTLADSQLPISLNPLFSGSRADLEVSSALWAAPVVFDAQFHVQPDQLIGAFA